MNKKLVTVKCMVCGLDFKLEKKIYSFFKIRAIIVVCPECVEAHQELIFSRNKEVKP